MVSINDNVRLVNVFEQYARSREEPLTEKDSQHIQNRIEGVVDAAVYRYTGQKVFQDTYRQVEKPMKDAVMGDIDVSSIDVKDENTPVVDILPRDFKLKSKKTDTSLLDSLKIPTMAIPVLPTLGVVLGKGLSSPATLLSLGALLLEAFAALKDIKDFKSKRPKPRAPKPNPDKPKANWWKKIKKNKNVLRVVQAFSAVFNNKFTKPMIDWFVSLQDNVSSLASSIKKLFDDSVGWVKNRFDQIATALRRMASSVYTKLMDLLKIAAEAAFKAGRTLPKWMNDSKTIKNLLPTWVKNWPWIKNAPSSIVKNFKRVLGPFGVALDAIFIGMEADAIGANWQTTKSDLTGESFKYRNLHLDQRVKDIDMFGNYGRGVLGNSMKVLGFADPSNAVTLINYLDMMDGYKDTQMHKAHVNSIEHVQRVLEQADKTDDEHATETFEGELKDFIKSGHITQERYDEIINHPAIRQLAIEISKYNEALSNSRQLRASQMENYIGKQKGFLFDMTVTGYDSRLSKNYRTRRDGEAELENFRDTILDNETKYLSLLYFLANPDARPALQRDSTNTGILPIPQAEELTQLFTGDLDTMQMSVVDDDVLMDQQQADDRSDRFEKLRDSFMVDEEFEQFEDAYTSIIDKNNEYSSVLGDRIQMITRMNNAQAQELMEQQLEQQFEERSQLLEPLIEPEPTFKIGDGGDKHPIDPPTYENFEVVTTSGTEIIFLQLNDGSEMSLDLRMSQGQKVEDAKKMMNLLKDMAKNSSQTRQDMINIVNHINKIYRDRNKPGEYPELYIPETFDINIPEPIVK